MGPEGFEGLGFVLASHINFFRSLFEIPICNRFWSVLEGFGKGLGRVWGRFGEGLGRAWEGLGKVWGGVGEGLGRGWGGFGYDWKSLKQFWQRLAKVWEGVLKG